MRKLEKRAVLCLFFTFLLLLGTIFYIGKFIKYGKQWISFPANRHIYSEGKLSTGTIKDRSGRVLLTNDESGNPLYIDNASMRKSLVHTLGDANANISTGANRAFRDKLIGYNLISGTYAASGEGRTITLTVDGSVSQVAREALGDNPGAVAVFNYKTGEIICMVSSPNYDPQYPPSTSDDNTSGAFINRVTSSAIVPGSIFKLVTSAAAIENISNLDSWSYTCTGEDKYGDYKSDKVTCIRAHGKQNFKEALANSCNCAFGRISNELGASKLKAMTKQSGLTSEYDIDGIKTTPGSFEFPSDSLSLAWSGIGQFKDLVNPLSMMVYMGAIAGGGDVRMPYLIKDVQSSGGLPVSFKMTDDTKTLLNASTAAKLQDMMKFNVEETYGTWNFPNLDIYAKSGTAEHESGATPHAWFTGFIKNENHPYAFVVLVEKGGYGQSAAANVANAVLQECLNLN